MENYVVEYYKKALTVPGSKPHGPYLFNVSAENIEQATISATKELFQIGMKSADNDVWDAYIQDSQQRKVVMLHNGGWLIDTNTGRPLEKKEKDSLERRM